MSRWMFDGRKVPSQFSQMRKFYDDRILSRNGRGNLSYLQVRSSSLLENPLHIVNFPFATEFLDFEVINTFIDSELFGSDSLLQVCWSQYLELFQFASDLAEMKSMNIAHLLCMRWLVIMNRANLRVKECFMKCEACESKNMCIYTENRSKSSVCNEVFASEIFSAKHIA